jgi:hypothetical protein
MNFKSIVLHATYQSKARYSLICKAFENSGILIIEKKKSKEQ